MTTRDEHAPISNAGPLPCFDVAIFGAGVAGLWTATRLSAAGWRVLVLETGAIGGGQTIGSQGIIHGGIKYALTGQASRASEAISRMPEIWNACLNGEPGAELDLRSVRVLSREQFLWTTPGVVSRLAGLGASKAIRTHVERVAADDRPGWLREAPRGVAGLGGVDVYRVAEPVLETHSTIAALLQQARRRGVVLARCGAGADSWSGSDRSGDRAGVLSVCRPADAAGASTTLAHPQSVRMRVGAVVLTAGEGNERLAHQLGACPESMRLMQLRPLHMVLARNVPAVAAGVFGHCLGSTTTPRITVTGFESAGSTGQGVAGWYIGGEIAESGVRLDEDEQRRAARAELAGCLKWLDLSRIELATVRWNRAEGLTADGTRPDEPVVRAFHAGPRPPVIVGWPTKLAFAPELARRVHGELTRLGAGPGLGACGSTEAELGLPEPAMTPPVWELEGLRWR